MLLNDVHEDVKKLCIDEKVSLAEACFNADVSPQVCQKAFKSQIFNNTLLNVLECMGYDVRIEYVPRGGTVIRGTNWTYDGDEVVCPHCGRRVKYRVVRGVNKPPKVCECGVIDTVEEY